METSPDDGADWPEAMSEETPVQGNNESATEEEEGTESRSRPNFPWPMVHATPVQEELEITKESDPEEVSPATPPEAAQETFPGAPWNLNQYMANSDTDTGRHSEAESTRSDKEYVNVAQSTSYSTRTWRT